MMHAADIGVLIRLRCWRDTTRTAR